MKITVKCKNCEKEFQKLYSEIKKTKNNYCSLKCCNKINAIENKTTHVKKRESCYLLNPKKCLNCFVIIPYNKRTNTYCSIRCSAIFTQKDRGHCKWSDENKQKLKELSKKNPYFNGEISTIIKNNRKKLNCINCNLLFDKPPSSKKIACCRKCYYDYIKNNGILKGKRGGYREKGGRGKQGWYKNYYCNSSWELAWVIYQLEHNTNFKRNKEGFKYQFEGKEYKFYPDFIIDDNQYVEIKGYMGKKNEAKINSFPHKLIVIDRKKIKPYINYVIKKYGKDYIKLYN